MTTHEQRLAALDDDARGWLADCEWQDLTPEDCYDLPIREVWQAIKRHYEGGIDAFLRDTGLLEEA